MPSNGEEDVTQHHTRVNWRINLSPLPTQGLYIGYRLDSQSHRFDSFSISGRPRPSERQVEQIDVLPTHIFIGDEEAIAAFKKGRGDDDIQTAAESFERS